MNKGELALLLLKIMKEQLDVYKELLCLAQKKTDVLVKGDVKLLGKITEVEQKLIINLGKLEEERYSIVRDIAREQNTEISNVNVDFVKRMLNEREAEKFHTISDELKAVLLEVEEKNKINERLIKNALDYIKFSINILTSAGEAKSSYGADGTSTRKEVHFIDKKA